MSDISPPTVITDNSVVVATPASAAGLTGPVSSAVPVISSAAADVIGVLDMSTLQPVFPDARPLRVSPAEGLNVMEHPLETGAIITDHIVQKPTEIVYPVAITANMREVVAEIRRIALAGTLLIVQTRGGDYKNMVLYDWPRDETPEFYNGSSAVLKFRYARFITPQTGGLVPRAAKHSSTQKRGQVQAQTPTPQARGSLLYRLVPKF